jgi:hypothetical protein
MCTSSPKKLIKFTQISRTVWTFVKKTEISQHTENFHQCYYIYFILKHSYYCNIEVY